MSEENKVFDVDQGHGNHLDTILDGISIEDLMTTLPDLLQNADLIAVTKQEISCNLDEGHPAKMGFTLLGNTKENGRLSMLIGLGKENHELLSFYPEYDGMEVKIVLTQIHEWANGVEATLEGTMLDGQREIAFFDTRYIQSKEQYEIGKTYVFRLSAFAFNANVLDERTFQFTGDEAVKHRERCGMEQEYEENGMPRPVVFDMSKMVALIQSSVAYPHEAEFQSPVFSISQEKLFGGNFYKIEIAIAHEEMNGEEIRIPLITKQSFFKKQPQQDDPVRGNLWMLGYQTESGKEFSAKDMADMLAKAWIELDCTGVRRILADDFEYTSQWVLDTMHGADHYMEYLSEKFSAMKKGGRPTITAVRNNSNSIELDMAQTSKGETFHQMLQFEIVDGKLSKACMCDPSFRRL